MIKDSNLPKETEKVAADICIIGTGPAGMTLCSELSDMGVNICLVESGGKKHSQSAEELNEIISNGEITIKPSSRERVLGGTSTKWSGISAPLDKVDFEQWPISLEEVRQYYRRADKYGFPSAKDFESYDAQFLDGNLSRKKFIASKTPWNFAKKLKPILKKPNVRLLINSTVTDLEGDKINNIVRVTAANVSTDNNSKIKVMAKIFVLAAGGLENSRLLLTSNIGNEYDQVGRYIMDHPKGTYGVIKLDKKVDELEKLLGVKKEKWYTYAGLHMREALHKKLGILNSYIRLEPESYSRSILERLGLRKSPPVRVLRLRNFMEMEPRPENRLTLSDKLDRHGKPLPIVTINTSELDRKSVIQLHQMLGEEIKKNGIGTLESNLDKEMVWPINSGASHHMGGTRMGDDKKTSVVDRNLRVHSTENLYISGSSVFPTGGSANPTYTICALSIRLADYIKEHLISTTSATS